MTPLPPSPSSPTMFQADKARQYDQRMGRALPGYDTLHHLTCQIIAADVPESGSVLVVGAGTATECIAMSSQHPTVRICGVDPAADMIAHGQAKVEHSGLADRISLHPVLLSDLPAMPAFDAATLLLVLHFLPDDGQKLALLSEIAQRLRPGGVLVLADIFGPPWSDDGQNALRRYWRQMQVGAGMDTDEIERGFRMVDRAMHPLSTSRLHQILSDAGFAPPQPFFQAFCFGGWLCRRQSSQPTLSEITNE